MDGEWADSVTYVEDSTVAVSAKIVPALHPLGHEIVSHRAGHGWRRNRHQGRYGHESRNQAIGHWIALLMIFWP